MDPELIKLLTMIAGLAVLFGFYILIFIGSVVLSSNAVKMFRRGLRIYGSFQFRLSDSRIVVRALEPPLRIHFYVSTLYYTALS